MLIDPSGGIHPLGYIRSAMADLLAEAIASLNRARIVNVSHIRMSFSDVTHSSLQYVNGMHIISPESSNVYLGSLQLEVLL